MECTFDGSDGERIKVKIGDHNIRKRDSFRYLRSILQHDGEIDRDVTDRINVGWLKWRGASVVLRDKKIPLKIKGKFYKAAVRPAMLYGSDYLISFLSPSPFFFSSSIREAPNPSPPPPHRRRPPSPSLPPPPNISLTPAAASAAHHFSPTPLYAFSALRHRCHHAPASSPGICKTAFSSGTKVLFEPPYIGKC